MEEEFIFETDIPEEILDSFTNIKLVRGGMFKKFAGLFKKRQEEERQEEERQRQEERIKKKEEIKKQEEENIKMTENIIINYKNNFYTEKKFIIDPGVKIIITKFTKKGRYMSEYIKPEDTSILLSDDIYYLMFVKLFKEFTLISEIDKYLINYKKKKLIEKIKNSVEKTKKKRLSNTIRRKTSINIGLEEKEINIIQKIRKFNNNIIQIQKKIQEIYKTKTGKDKQKTPLYSLPLLFFIKEAYKTIKTPKDIKERLQQKYKEYIEKQEEDEKKENKNFKEKQLKQKQEEEKKEKNKYFTNLDNSMETFYKNPEINHFIQLKNDIDFISVKYKNTENLKDHSKLLYTFIKYYFILDKDAYKRNITIDRRIIYNSILLSKKKIINEKIENINKYLKEDNKIQELVIPSKEEKEIKKKEKVSQINLNNFLKGKNNNKEEEFNNSKEEEKEELETLKKKLKEYKNNEQIKELIKEIELYIETYENEITDYIKEIEEFKKKNIDILKI